MNITEKKGNYQKLSGALKKKFAGLTEDDQLYQEGQMLEVSGKKKIRLGKTEEELNKIIATL